VPRPHLANYRMWGGILFAPLVYVLMLRFDGLYGQDPYGYAQDAWNLHEWLRGGPVPPPFFWTRGYSGLGALLSLPFGSPSAAALALQAVSILSLALTGMWAGAWMRDRYPTLPNIADGLTIMIIFAPFLFRAGLVVMSDMPAIACATLALWQVGRYLRAPSAWRHLAWASLACGLMAAFRYALVPLLLLPMLGAAWTALRHRRLAHLALPLLAGLPIGLLWLSLPDAMPAPVHSTVSAWSLGNLFTGDFVNADGQFHFPYPNLVYVLLLFVHPGYVGAMAAFTALGVWAARKAEKRVDLETGLLLGAVLMYMVFIGGLPFQNQRFLLPALPIVLLLYAPYWDFAFSVIPMKLHRWVWPAFGLASAFLIHHAMADIRRLNREEKFISQTLAEDGVRVLYTFDLAPALQFRDQGLRIYNFYDPHMPLPRPGVHVLSRFPDGLDQWAGLAPARNWARIQDSCKLLELYTFGATKWTLYEAR
jgi:4-amino-4-deoxy-L-arabinose transferase-like glycosyltransferase